MRTKRNLKNLRVRCPEDNNTRFCFQKLKYLGFISLKNISNLASFHVFSQLHQVRFGFIYLNPSSPLYLLCLLCRIIWLLYRILRFCCVLCHFSFSHFSEEQMVASFNTFFPSLFPSNYSESNCPSEMPHHKAFNISVLYLHFAQVLSPPSLYSHISTKIKSLSWLLGNT